MKSLRLCAFACLFILSSLASAFAQVPTTDIYLMDMKLSKGKYTFTNPQKISDWKGYNNQPYFTPDGKFIYYVSYRGKQSDVYRYEIKTKQTTQFTNTPEDEYSPKLTPDGKFISVVRVMKDSAQQLWEFPLDGGSPHRILKGMDSIGYYCWMGSNVATANVPVPMKLKIMDSFDAGPYFEDSHMKIDPTLLVKNVGRTLIKLNNELLYIQKTSDKNDSTFWIYKADKKFKVEKLIQTLKGSEDFALGPKKILYSGYQGKLYKYRIGKDKDWVEIADFNNTPYKNFYRLVVSEKGDKIAVVSYEGKKP